jgi:hypothetical protein
MGNPTRFKNGVTNNGINTPTGNMPVPDRNNLCIYQNDFLQYTAGDWTVVAGGAGSGTALSTSIVGGALALTWGTSGTQSNTLIGGAFAFNPATSSGNGLQFWFEAGLVLPADTSAPNYVIGAIKGAPTAPSDGVYFTKAAAGTAWQIVIKAAAASTTTVTLPSPAVAVNSARTSIGFYYDGRGNPTMYVYYGGICVGSFGANGTLGTLANLPLGTILLNPTMAIGTAAGPLNVDYLTCACEIPARV